jgi:hypothetical protein
MQAYKRAGKRTSGLPSIYTRVKRSFCRLIINTPGFFVLLLVFSLTIPVSVFAAADSLEITGDGVTNPLTLTLEQLEKMDQQQYLYSVVNTWPTKKWYVGEGVKLWDLLVKAGIKEEAALVKFSSMDGYVVTLTVKELFQDGRYCYPNFRSGDSAGHIPGDPSGKVKVEPIIALLSVEGSDNPKYMNELNSLMLMLGQRAVTEQTGNIFVKYLHKIEVLTVMPDKWDAPQANPGSGTVPAGAMVTLSNNKNDDDKIYYTTDGTTPNLESPMYNWIASRWWSARADVLGTINRPIGPINTNTTIKAVTIGPGKLDSDIMIFEYQVDSVEPIPSGKTIELTIGRKEALVNSMPYFLEVAPYISLEAKRTLVPLRFVSEALGADVVWNSETRQVSIIERGINIILNIGSSDVMIDGVKKAIDSPATILPPGRTFVPLRFVAETLGAQVDYQAGEIRITR